ncbi:MAG: efflux transporter outer membrane subunit [Deltaproteobacteria bacterium]|nr:MAG: efflux transporter outer membrane subunit [Deltaproteobacteria bacterium]
MRCGMNRAVRAPVTLIALSLTACATPVPQVWTPTLVPKSFTGPVTAEAPVWPDAAWWQAFRDPELAELVSAAQLNNHDLAAAAARVLQAEVQTTIQRAALFPQITGQVGHSNAGCSGQACLQYASGKAYGLSVNASYELDVWGLVHANLRAAQEQLKSARFAQQSLALSVTANTANQYFNVLAIRRRLAIAHEDIDAINGILEVIKLRVKAGATSHLDLAREEAQLEAVKAQLPGLETTEQESLFTLAALLGRPPEGFAVAAHDLDGIAQPELGAGLPSDLLLRRPDVAQAEANLAAAHADLDATRAAFLPQISLTGSGGFISAATSALLQGSNFGYSYGATLLQTIFDAGRLSGQKALAVGAQKEFIADYQRAVLNAFVDVENALVEVANARKAREHLKREVDAAREAFEIAQLQYRQGATDLLTVLQAQQTLFSAEDQLAQITLANCQAAVHLYEALGGGWVENAEDRTQFASN